MSELPPILSIAIVANDPLARAGLAALLAAEPTCEVVAQLSLADWLADLQVDEWTDLGLDGVMWELGHLRPSDWLGRDTA